MSRLPLALSFVVALTSAAAAAPSFAQPPPSAPAPSLVTRDQVRAMLIENRAANLARFRAYQQGLSFPSNVYTGGALNVWRDADGKFCAAATIIRASGATALVDQIASDDNFIKLGTVTSGPVLDWILTSGLTQAELALIQRPFRPVANRPSEEAPELVAISPSLRAKETARLAKLYTQIEATLRKQEKRSLDAAVARLMKRPDLAARLVHGS